MLYINTQTLEYPVTEQQIREAFPNTSFPVDFVPIAPFKEVLSVVPPTVNSFIETLVEGVPSKVGSIWKQSWKVVPITSDQLKARIPLTITIRQAKLALLDAGLLDTVNTAISKATRNVQIEWEYATEVERSWPTLLEVQTALGLTDKQIDDLFILASTK